MVVVSENDSQAFLLVAVIPNTSTGTSTGITVTTETTSFVAETKAACRRPSSWVERVDAVLGRITHRDTTNQFVVFRHLWKFITNWGAPLSDKLQSETIIC